MASICPSFAPTFSLILATYGRAEVLAPLIDSLGLQSFRDFELVIADQNPDDRVRPYVDRCRALGFHVVHLKLDQPNLSAARNRALEQASGTWVAFPDDDCWYEPGALEAVYTKAKAQAGIHGYVIEWVEHAAAVPSGNCDSHLEYSRWRNLRGDDASSIRLFVRRDWANRAEGFDERMGVGQYFGSGEETDFVLRLLRDGAAIECNRTSRVHHHFSATSEANSQTGARKVARERARGTGAIYAKHRMTKLVIARGLLSPLLRALLRGASWSDLVIALEVMRGRWEGWRRWH